MDILSETLQIVRLSSTIFFTAKLSEPWSVLSPPPSELAEIFHAKSECIILFHVVKEGQCWIKTEEKGPFYLDKGSIILIPQATSHTMCSKIDLNPKPLKEFVNFGDKGALNLTINKNGKSKTKLICGYLKCNQHFNPMINSLPEFLLLSTKQETINKNLHQNPDLTSQIMSIEAGGWIDKTTEYLNREVENKNVGSTAIINRLTELLFIEILRRYVQQLPEDSHGWLAALKDPKVGLALQLLHSNPEKKWSVNQLAVEVGVSRSALAQRFQDVIGESPIKYLTEWRMQLAKNLLVRQNLNLTMIAEKVGYDSEIAFNRAFKRYTGKPPAFWRSLVLKDAILN